MQPHRSWHGPQLLSSAVYISLHCVRSLSTQRKCFFCTQTAFPVMFLYSCSFQKAHGKDTSYYDPVINFMIQTTTFFIPMCLTIFLRLMFLNCLEQKKKKVLILHIYAILYNKSIFFLFTFITTKAQVI